MCGGGEGNGVNALTAVVYSGFLENAFIEPETMLRYRPLLKNEKILGFLAP